MLDNFGDNEHFMFFSKILEMVENAWGQLKKVALFYGGLNNWEDFCQMFGTFLGGFGKIVG